MDTVRHNIVRELVAAKTPKVLKTLPNGGAGWTVHYTFFARIGFTAAARQEAGAHGTLLVNLDTLDRDLR